MIITVNREAFLDALHIVGYADAESLQFSVTGDSIGITAIGRTISVRTKLACMAESCAEFSAQIKDIADYVRQLAGEKLQIECELPEKITIKCGRSRAKVALSRDAYKPDFKRLVSGSSFGMKGCELSEFFGSIAFIPQADDTRYYAAGALLSTQRLVASDAVRLGCVENTFGLDKTGDDALIVNKRTLDAVKSLAGNNQGIDFVVKFSKEQNAIHVIFGNTEIFAQAISGEYPPYEAAIPKTINFAVTVNRKELLECLKRAALFADKNKTGKLSFDGSLLALDSMTPGQKEGSESIDLAEPVASPFEVNFNLAHLQSLLSNLQGDVVTFAFETVHKPVKLTGDCKDKFYLLVPTRF